MDARRTRRGVRQLNPVDCTVDFGTVGGVQRGIALGVPALTVALGAGLYHEVHRVAHAPLPTFDDNDPSGTYGDPLGDAVRVAVLGDSSVTAPGLAHGRFSWVALACDSLDARIHLRSLARGGARLADLLEHQVPALLEDPPDVVIAVGGANDVMHATPVRTFRRQLGELLDQLSEASQVVSLGIGDLSVIPRLPPTLRGLVARRSATMDRVHREVCDQRSDVVRVSVRDLADPFFAGTPSGLFTADAFHPNEVGHRIWASCFERPLREAIGRTRQASVRSGSAVGDGGACIDLRAGRCRSHAVPVGSHS